MSIVKIQEVLKALLSPYILILSYHIPAEIITINKTILAIMLAFVEKLLEIETEYYIVMYKHLLRIWTD